jgi:hypothetical protein
MIAADEPAAASHIFFTPRFHFAAAISYYASQRHTTTAPPLFQLLRAPFSLHFTTPATLRRFSDIAVFFILHCAFFSASFLDFHFRRAPGYLLPPAFLRFRFASHAIALQMRHFHYASAATGCTDISHYAITILNSQIAAIAFTQSSATPPR